MWKKFEDERPRLGKRILFRLPTYTGRAEEHRDEKCGTLQEHWFGDEKRFFFSIDDRFSFPMESELYDAHYYEWHEIPE